MNRLKCWKQMPAAFQSSISLLDFYRIYSSNPVYPCRKTHKYFFPIAKEP